MKNITTLSVVLVGAVALVVLMSGTALAQQEQRVQHVDIGDTGGEAGYELTGEWSDPTTLEGCTVTTVPSGGSGHLSMPREDQREPPIVTITIRHWDGSGENYELELHIDGVYMNPSYRSDPGTNEWVETTWYKITASPEGENFLIELRNDDGDTPVSIDWIEYAPEPGQAGENWW